MPHSRPRRTLPSASLAALMALSVSLVVVAAPAEDWTSFRGPHGNGRKMSGLPVGDRPLQLEVRWQRPLGSGYSGVSLTADVGVVGTSSGDSDQLMAFDPQTGEERWSTDIGPLTVGAAGSKDGPISTPALGEGRVFVVSTQGRLLALDLGTGEPLWSTHLVEDLGSRRPVYGFSTSPVVAGDLVVVQVGGAEGALAGFDAATGDLRWRTFEDQHYAQSPIVTDLAGRSQVVTMGSTRVVGVDPSTGDELWSHTHGGTGEFGPESATPMPIGDDRLFVKHDNERSSVLQIQLQNDETFVAEVLNVNRTMTRSYSPPTVWDGVAYGYTSRFLSALDLETGEELWRSRAPGDGFLSAVEGMLLVATKNDGTVHLAEANRQEWREVFQVELFDDLVWTPPSIHDGAFYVRSLTEMARVDVVRAATRTTNGGGSDLPPELESLQQRIENGRDAQTEVTALLRDLDGPLVDGERVLFLWRGEAEEVGIAGDMFGFRYDEPMQRLEGTDLWWWQSELDRRGRFNYVFFPDYEPALDPRNPRSVESTAMGPDLNHRGAEALQVSWFSMPEWPGLRTNAPPPDQGAAGRLETFDVEVDVPTRPGPGGGGASQAVTVPVTVWLPPGYEGGEARYPTVMSLERYAIPIGNWPAALAEAVASGRVAPLIGVMIDAPEGFYGRRGGGRAGALAPAVIAAVDARYRTLAAPEHRAVVGALYTGPPALGLSLGADRLFGRVAVQSPFAIDVMLPMFQGQIDRAADAPRPESFYFEWAHWDMRSLGEGLVLGEFMEDLNELFVAAGYDVTGGEVWDSTDWAGWRNRTGLILEVLFADPDEAAPEELGLWLVDEKK